MKCEKVFSRDIIVYKLYKIIVQKHKEANDKIGNSNIYTINKCLIGIN